MSLTRTNLATEHASDINTAGNANASRYPFFVLIASLTIVLSGQFADTALAQYKTARRHDFKNARLPAGTIGKLVQQQHPELIGVMQPVLIKVPEGASVAVAEGAGFSYGTVNATLASLQVGETYRLKVSNIPNQYGDVYPTIELIDRLHPPPGKELRYPIPIQLTEEELSMALRGKYVTRVIYVEDPRRALAVRDLPDSQRYFEVMSHEDPYRVASRLGRPVAILRMGSVAPSSQGPSAAFLFHSPPVERHAMLVHQVPYVPSKLDASELPAKPVERDELPKAGEQPQAPEAPLTIREDLPGKKDLPDEPADETDPFIDDDLPPVPDNEGTDGAEDPDPFSDLELSDNPDPFAETKDAAVEDSSSDDDEELLDI